MLRRRVYLDHAAATPVLKVSYAAFRRALSLFGNPSSAHSEGVFAKALLERCRTQVAREVGVKADAVIFTSGATEANALLILGHIETLIGQGRSGDDMHVLYSESAHASVRETVEALSRKGVVIETIPFSDGGVDLEAFRAKLKDTTVLVVIDLVESETGIEAPTRAMARLLIDRYAESNKPLFHVDGSQAPRVERIQKTHLGFDTFSLDAQKIGGIRGCGALIVPRTIPLAPRVFGGGQERGIRSGTESVALIASFAEALTHAGASREAFLKKTMVLREEFLRQVTRALPFALVNEGKEQAPHIINLSFPGYDTEYLVHLLDAKGFSVSTKSACETGEPYSKAVYAYTKDKERASATLRISLGNDTTERELSSFSRALFEAITFLEKSRLEGYNRS